MLRKLCLVAMCALALAAGCRKKEEEPTTREERDKEPPKQQQVQVPEGFARVGEQLFMTRRPPRIQEYVSYLESTGQDLPERLKAPDVNYQDPVTGLAREEAKAFATWKMLRLPTRREWDAAEQVVGSVPYPWDAETPPDAPLYLVRDWTEGSQAHQKARNARDELRVELLNKRRSEVEMGRNMLSNLVEERTDTLREEWQRFKTSLSELVEKQKQHARQAAATEGRQVVLQVLKQVGKRKQKLIHAKFDAQAAAEDLQNARKEYEQFLEQQRNDVQELKTRVVDANQKLSEQARGLMEELERVGENLITRLPEVAGQHDAPLDNVQNMGQLAEMRRGLQDAISRVKNRATESTGTFRAATRDVETRAEDLDAKLEDLPEEQTTSEKIQQLQENIQELNKNLEDQFVQEPHLFQELNEYVDLAATKQALQQEVVLLRKMVALVQQPGQPAQTPPEEPAPPVPPEPTEDVTEPPIDG